jgi:adenylate kinase family enzyme
MQMTKEAQSNIVDEILWGNSYHGHDITSVIDGEPVDTFFRLYVSRRKDDADKWLEELVTLYVQRHEELMEFYRQDEEERARENAIDAERERRYQVAEAI